MQGKAWCYYYGYYSKLLPLPAKSYAQKGRQINALYKKKEEKERTSPHGSKARPYYLEAGRGKKEEPIKREVIRNRGL